MLLKWPRCTKCEKENSFTPIYTQSVRKTEKIGTVFGIPCITSRQQHRSNAEVSSPRERWKNWYLTMPSDQRPNIPSNSNQGLCPCNLSKHPCSFTGCLYTPSHVHSCLVNVKKVPVHCNSSTTIYVLQWKKSPVQLALLHIYHDTLANRL